LGGRSDTLGEVARRLKKADELAEKYSKGGILCRVSRHVPSVISLKEYVVRLGVPYDAFTEQPIGAGGYLAVVNALNLQLVLLRVIGVARRDLESYLGGEPPITSVDVKSVVPGGLLTPVEVWAEPVVAFDYDEEKGDYTYYSRGVELPVEPQSPVFVPKPEILVKLLGLPEEGCVLGCMVTEGLRPLTDVPVRLPLPAFYQHVLITGTTGAGKTTLVKNMVADIVSEFQPGEVTIVVLDSTGEYAQVVCDKPEWNPERLFLTEEEEIREAIYEGVVSLQEIGIILPITRAALTEYCKDISSPEDVAMRIAAKYFERTLKPLGAELAERPEVSVKSGITEECEIYIALGGTRPATVKIYPWALEFEKVGAEITELSPMFTFQARDMLRPIIEDYLKTKGPRKLDVFADYLGLAGEVYGRVSNMVRRMSFREAISTVLGSERDPIVERLIRTLYELSVHTSTLKNILRSIRSLSRSDLFDVEACGVKIVEPNYEKIMAENDVVVVDIQAHASGEESERVIVYRLLDMLFKYKYRAYRERRKTKPLIVIVDEAHRYFPARYGKEEEGYAMIASMLTRIARLGRRHGLGLVFATHAPQDLNPIVVQLTNTKITLRSDKQVLERLGIPLEYRRILEIAPDRVGLVRSHFYRTHYVLFKTTPPLVGHMDISSGIKPSERS